MKRRCDLRKKVTIRGVESETWIALKQMRNEEQRLLGAIVSEAILEYQEYHYGNDGSDGEHVEA